MIENYAQELTQLTNLIAVFACVGSTSKSHLIKEIATTDLIVIVPIWCSKGWQIGNAILFELLSTKNTNNGLWTRNNTGKTLIKIAFTNLL